MGFVHETKSQRVRFGSGEGGKGLAEEIAELSAERVMVIAAPAEIPLAKSLVGALPVTVWHADVAMHVPLEVADHARKVAADRGIDALVSIGGGSTTGLAKAVALTSGLPIVAVPTTYSGSEATNVWGLTDGARKVTGADDRVLPRCIVYDASLTLTLPAGISAASGLNALAHCMDSMWAPRKDPINAVLAEEGIRVLSLGLPAVVTAPSELPGRELALQGAYLSAMAFASAGAGLHHKICHVLGGMFNLPHAQTHAVVLPHVLAFNTPNAPEAERRIARAFGAPSANQGLASLRAALSAPMALRDLGMPEAGIDEAVEAVLAAVQTTNPTRLTRENTAALLRAAWEGDLAR